MAKTKELHAAVQDELVFDPLVDASNISVKNLGGSVALNGTVSSYPQYLRAAAAARRVAGVTSVHNHLAVSLPPGDYRDDPTLTTAANNALALHVSVPEGVEAEAQDGDITLTGMVRYGYQRTAAEAAVAGLTGVRNCKDDIDVWWDAEAEPADVTTAVQTAMNRYALVPEDTDVTVETSGNTVTLTGHVQTWAEHDAILDAAWMTPAVYTVEDMLLVTG